MNTKKVDKALDILIIIFVLTMFIGTIIVWFNLPQDIPNHIDSCGNIKDYTSKNFLFFFSIIGSVIGVVSYKLSKHPEIYNYAVTINDKNREFQYNNSSRMLKLLAIETIIIFGFLEYCMVNAKRASVVYLLVVIVFITIAYFTIKSIKHKEK